VVGVLYKIINMGPIAQSIEHLTRDPKPVYSRGGGY